MVAGGNKPARAPVGIRRSRIGQPFLLRLQWPGSRLPDAMKHAAVVAGVSRASQQRYFCRGGGDTMQMR